MNSEQMKVLELLPKHKNAKTIEQQTPYRKEILNILENLGYDKPTFSEGHNYTFDEAKKAWHYKIIDTVWINDLKFGRK